jgi:hypothetical protein
MSKQKLIPDPITGELSRLSGRDLPLIGISGLDDDSLLTFGSSPKDFIEYCLYDISDSYLGSGKITYVEMTSQLDVGAHVRGLGYERGTYKIVYNFLREIGGSDNYIITKKKDKSIYTGQYLIEPSGKLFAAESTVPSDVEPEALPHALSKIIDENGKPTELLLKEDKFWIQEISPSKTEIRLRPNPGIVDTDYFEDFRLLGYTCLSYSDISGVSNITFAGDGKTTTINGGTVTLDQSMVGGTLKIREAFVIDYEETEEQISRYTPEVDTEAFPAAQNLVTNGHFANESGIWEVGYTSNNHDIVEFSNPGASRYVLKTTGLSSDSNNQYQLLLTGIPGESYIMSCWVHFDQDWPTDKHELFSGTVEAGGSDQAFHDFGEPFDTAKNIEENSWYHVFQVITLPVGGNGTFKLNLGKTSDIDTGNRYITNVQVEAGSVSGTPTSYMISGERVEEEDSPTTGLITFIDDNKVEATFTTEDTGFIGSMVGGKLTIKDAYVTDQNFTQDSELTIIDDIPLNNPDASDIQYGEREWRVSPYHGHDFENRIKLQVDNAYDLYSVDSAGSETLLGSGTDWRTSEEYPLPANTTGLRISTRNTGGPGAIIAKVWFNGDVVKTGDGKSAHIWAHYRHRWGWGGWGHRWLSPSIIRRFAGSSGPFDITSFTDNDGNVTTATESDPISWKKKANAGSGPWGKNVDPDLTDCDWIWSVANPGHESIEWTWTGGTSITDLIWQYWDPDPHSDAVKPEGWSDGFNSFNYGGTEESPNGKFTRSDWHSGWLGHHAKWVDGDGEYGGNAMKFIDKNSHLESPNHNNYPPSELHKTGHNTDPDQPTTLSHRWMAIAQTLPHKMVSQGIKPGDQITISWNQKSDTANKGAMVGLRYYKISDGIATWGTWTGYHPSTIGDDENGEPMLKAGEREFLRYIPVSTVGNYERVSYNAIVEEDWDLSAPTQLYIYGMYGPEGILWVENVQVELSETTDNIGVSPTYTDLVGEIASIDESTVTLTQTYTTLAPDGAIFDNTANIHKWNIFTNFYVDYTSSLAESTPIYGSLRGDIESISGNSITLKSSYSDLGEEEGHDFENTLDTNQNSEFNKWFIQYPNDNHHNLSKLLRLGPNNHHLITNFKFDTQEYPDYPHSLVYKLYKPLPSTVFEHDFITVVREMIPPKEEVVQLIPFVEQWVSDIVLRTPEFQSVTSPIGSGQVKSKTYNELTTTDGGIQESIENELLSGSLSADINVDFNLFENFVHFSSAEQRVKNFKYKLDLIEQYTDRSASLAGTNSGSIGEPIGRHSVKADPGAGAYLNVSGSENPHPSFTPVSGSLVQIQSWEKKRRETINTFDKFEKYMFIQTSSYSSESIGVFHDNAWPKESGQGTYSTPYILYRTSQSAATDWYSEQILSASAYDKSNKNRLKGHLPMFVQDDDENDVFLRFVDMIGHYFDDIWVFIKSMTDVYDRRDKLTEGIARNLLYPIAQSLGWEVSDGKDLVSLPRYMFGMEATGSEKPWQFSGTSDRDISREIWSRIINNMPYFLKTKGTSRAIKGLISCYGIPSSILRVMEYGGPSLPNNSANFMITRKFTKALDFFGSGNNTYVQYNAWSPVISGSGATNRVPDTVEFRFRAVTGSNQVLVRRGDDWAIRLKDNGSVDNRGYVSFMLSGSEGYKEVSSSNFPVYDGEFWSVMLARTLWDGSFVGGDIVNQNVAYTLHTKKYDAGRSKIIYESSETLYITGSSQPSYNLAYVGTADTITIGGPQENTYFGESLSGSMMEYRNWTTALNESAFDNHVAAPIAFDGNTPSASYIDLVTRYSFDDNKDLSVSYNQWFRDVTADQSFTASATPHNYTSLMTNTDGTHFSSVVDETKFKVPNFGPSGKSSNKLRIEADKRIDEFGNPELKFYESIVAPSYDTAPIDSNKLGVYFSPSNAIDEDIISSMPNIDFDQYIGDPRDQYKEQYTGLVTARNLYWQKYAGPNNFWDYLRLLKYYDSSLYKQVRTLVPARANANVGILIEPTLLERDKIIIGKKPTFEPQHHTTFIDTMAYISESAAYQTYEDNMNWSNPFGINKESMTTGSYLSSSARYETVEANLTYTDPFRVNYYTQLSGSEPRGFISASSATVTPWGWNTLPINLHDPFRLNNRTQASGSGVGLSATFSSYNAPSTTLSENAAGTGSFVMKHILERPAIYNIGDRDFSGWYGSDYYNSTIQAGSSKAIFEEVVQPRYERNVTSQFNDEIEYYYSSSLSASIHKPYSSSFVRSDLDNRWDESVGTDRLFYLGCVQTDTTTVSDPNGRWNDDTPAFAIELVSPTMLVASDKTNTKMDAVNK